MKVASSGSRRAISSASSRIRAHTGSTFWIAPALTCRWAMIVSRIRPAVSLAQFDLVIDVYEDYAAKAGDALTTIERATSGQDYRGEGCTDGRLPAPLQNPQGCSARKRSTAALNTLSPTASM